MLALTLFLTFLSLSPSSTTASPHFSKRRLDHSHISHRTLRRQEAVLRCDGLYHFQLCLPNFVDCSVSQSVAEGTVCVDNAIAMAPPAGETIQAIDPVPSTPASSSSAIAVETPASVAPAEVATSIARAAQTFAALAVDLKPVLATPTFVSVPVPVATPSSSASTGDVFNGKGTFFLQEGGFGACGKVHADSVPLVALALARYGTLSNNAPDCGRNVRVTNTANGKSVVCIVADACPGCSSFDSLDLSTGAFDQIADEATGVIPISWTFIN